MKTTLSILTLSALAHACGCHPDPHRPACHRPSCCRHLKRQLNSAPDNSDNAFNSLLPADNTNNGLLNSVPADNSNNGLLNSAPTDNSNNNGNNNAGLFPQDNNSLLPQDSGSADLNNLFPANPIDSQGQQPGQAPTQNADSDNQQASNTQSIPSTIFDDLPGFLGITFPGQANSNVDPSATITPLVASSDQLAAIPTESPDNTTLDSGDNALDKVTSDAIPRIHSVAALAIALLFCSYF
ncbi:hypothetical protein IWW54_001953 [Coemansia sp. RSA 2705]|nr:hypothetical protein IWW54_001953 [Coemansia sp. RSA 2705]